VYAAVTIFVALVSCCDVPFVRGLSPVVIMFMANKQENKQKTDWIAD
jgi:hypothetical protein